MDYKYVLVSLLVIALFLSIVRVLGDRVVYPLTYSLDFVDRGSTLVYNGVKSPISLVGFYVFEKKVSRPLSIVVDYKIKNLTYGTLSVVNLKLMYFATNITPLEPPSSVMSSKFYKMLYEGKVEPYVLSIGLRDKHVVIENVKAKYIVVLVILSLRQDALIDLSRYVPPIAYYPYPPPPIDLFVNIVKMGINNTYYRTALLYLSRQIENNTGNLIVYGVRLVRGSEAVSLGSVLIAWLLFIFLSTIYDHRLIPRAIKESIYILRNVLRYLLKIMRRLLEYIGLLHRS